MKQLASFSIFIFRLLLTSVIALCFQIFLIVQYPDYLLVVQETVKRLSRTFFQRVELQSSYQVAYNLINGDGLVAHTFFVLLAFVAIYILFFPAQLMRGKNRL